VRAHRGMENPDGTDPDSPASQVPKEPLDADITFWGRCIIKSAGGGAAPRHTAPAHCRSCARVLGHNLSPPKVGCSSMPPSVPLIQQIRIATGRQQSASIHWIPVPSDSATRPWPQQHTPMSPVRSGSNASWRRGLGQPSAGWRLVQPSAAQPLSAIQAVPSRAAAGPALSPIALPVTAGSVPRSHPFFLFAWQIASLSARRLVAQLARCLPIANRRRLPRRRQVYATAPFGGSGLRKSLASTAQSWRAALSTAS